jgi:signal transduction histidine kinase
VNDGAPQLSAADRVRLDAARRLHDGPQQTLTVLCMELSMAAGSQPIDAAQVERSLRHARSAFDEIGAIIEELREQAGAD